MPASIPNTYHAYHLYVIESEKRDELAKFLAVNNVGTALHYPSPIHKQPAYLGRIKGESNLNVTEKLYEKILTLPMFPELSDQEVNSVTSLIVKFYK